MLLNEKTFYDEDYIVRAHDFWSTGKFWTYICTQLCIPL